MIQKKIEPVYKLLYLYRHIMWHLDELYTRSISPQLDKEAQLNCYGLGKKLFIKFEALARNFYEIQVVVPL